MAATYATTADTYHPITARGRRSPPPHWSAPSNAPPFHSSPGARSARPVWATRRTVSFQLSPRAAPCELPTDHSKLDSGSRFRASVRLRQLPRQPTIVRRIIGLPLPVERRCRQLERVEDVAQVQLGDRGDGLLSQLSAS